MSVPLSTPLDSPSPRALSGHTPGPWHLVSGVHQRRFMPDDLVEIAANPSGLGFIACLYRHNWPDGTDEANANLIAAAPAMYAAIKEALSIFEQVAEDYYRLDPDIQALKAALALAEGSRP